MSPRPLLSRRAFLGRAAAGLAASVLTGPSRVLYAQKAGITAAEMRAAGTTAKITTLPLRGGLSVLMGSGGNILALPGRDGKVVVDSGFATSRTQVSAALEALSADPLRHLINTHWHYDHTDGNEWMHGAGATILAHEKTLERMNSGQKIPAFEAILPPSPAGALPTTVFATTHAVQLNGEDIQLQRYTPAHTDTDISVLFPRANVLHTGDTWFHGFYPFIDYRSGGSIDGLLTAAAENLKLADDQTVVVPGHGPIGQRTDLLAYRDMLAAIRAQIADLKSAGATLEAVQAAKPTARFDPQWGGGFITPHLFTHLVYRGV